MAIVVVGLNYRTAGIDLRERLHIVVDALPKAFETLRDLPECIILSTCNRLEIYASAEDAGQARQHIVDYLDRYSAGKLTPDQLYFYQDRAAVEHLMRVATGLESMLFGEAQILGQVVKALEAAQRFNTGGTGLTRLFTQAITAGKRARSETPINRYRVSLGQIALQYVEKHLDDLNNAHVLLIGGGEIAEAVIKSFRHRKVRKISVLNRTFQKAADLAGRISGEALAWEVLPDAIQAADVIITATSAQEPIIKQIESDKRRVLVDLSLPRNIDPALGALPNIYLYDLDHLKDTSAANLAQRQAAVAQIEDIIAQESRQFVAWLNGRRAVPLITELRRQAEDVAQAEVRQLLNRWGEVSAQEAQLISSLAQRIVNKLLHDPTLYIKDHAGDQEVIGVISALFNLKNLESAGGD